MHGNTKIKHKDNLLVKELERLRSKSKADDKYISGLDDTTGKYQARIKELEEENNKLVALLTTSRLEQAKLSDDYHYSATLAGEATAQRDRAIREVAILKSLIEFIVKLGMGKA